MLCKPDPVRFGTQKSRARRNRAATFSPTISDPPHRILTFSRETPPSTPQRDRAAARLRERNSRVLGSPEFRRTPDGTLHGNRHGFPVVEPIVFDFRNNVPLPQLRQDHGPANADDPFGQNAVPLVGFPTREGHVLRLTQGIAGRLAAAETAAPAPPGQPLPPPPDLN
ncbi:hypothetical protein FA15DRAFT_659832, partial [Coprinopsis marcescibilis]